MSAFLQQQPLIRPLSVREGFSVDATAFINSSFTVSANFGLESGESYSSTSISSPASPVVSTTSIPLIKVFPVDDDDCFRDCFPVEPGSGDASVVPILGYKNFCSGYAEDGFEREFEAKISQDLSLTTSNLGELQLAGPILGKAVTLYSDFNGLIISHPSILSLVLDDYGTTQYDTSEKDEGNTSLSTLDSVGPQTPPRSISPTSSDLEAEVVSDDVLNNAALASRRRRSRLASLDLYTPYETDTHAKSGSSSDINASLCTSSSASFITGKVKSGYLQEPLTPVTINFPGDQDHTPTHVRTPLANPARLPTPAKIRSRIRAGKENIAPLAIRSRRG